MNKIRFLNGADYFVYALDRNMHYSGLSGNFSIVLLEMDKPLDQTSLKAFIKQYFSRTPFFNVKFRSFLGLIFYWKQSNFPIFPDFTINTYNLPDPTPDAAVNFLLNQPLNRRNGNIIRFDIVNCQSRYFLCVAIDHVLTDACGIQQFLYSLTSDKTITFDNTPPNIAKKVSFLRKLRLIRKAMALLDSFTLKARPFSFSSYRKLSRSHNSFKTRHFSFPADDSQKIIETAHLRCGYLNETNYFLLSILKEFNKLYISSNLDPGSFVFPIVIHLGNKKHDTLSQKNNLTFLYYQVMKEEFEAGDTAIISSIKNQMTEQLRNDIPLGAYYGLQYLRAMPINIYRKKMYQSLKGELGSFFFSNIGSFAFNNNTLLGSKIINISHFPAVCFSPGIVFTFSKYENTINYTIVYIENLFNDNEIDILTKGINRSLLERS